MRVVVRCPACGRYLPGTGVTEVGAGWTVRRHGDCEVTHVADRWLVKAP